MLLKILLVDDNWYALNHFSHLVEWEPLGFSLVGTASDGIEGLKLYQKYHPDLIITDVQMPGMDGRELAKKVKEESPDTEIIFLSSYDEFDYARAAVDLGVYEYILKSELTKEALIQRLEKIQDRIRGRQKWERQQVKDCLLAYFRMSIKELEAEEHRSRSLTGGDAGLILIEQDHVPEQIAVQSGYQVKEADYRSLIGQMTGQIPELAYLIHIGTFLWIGIVSDEHDSGRIASEAERCLQGHAAESFSIYLCGGVRTVMDCRIRYEELRYLMKQRYFEGAQSQLRAELYERPKRISDAKLEELFQKADLVWEKAEKDTGKLLADIFRPLLYQRDFDSFMRMTCYLIHGMNEHIRKDPGIALYDEEVLYLLSAKRIVRWLRDKILKIRERMYPVYSHTVEEIIRYIEENYSSPALSVEIMAQSMGLSVNGMNSMLKKELGKTAGKYLEEIRMEKAGRLLREGWSIQKVSQQVGYNSSSYFSRAFHKICGVSPQAYRKLNTRTRTEKNSDR